MPIIFRVDDTFNGYATSFNLIKCSALKCTEFPRHLRNFGKFWGILRKIRSVASHKRPDRAGKINPYLSPTASMDSPWHKPPMSRATRELNRPSSTFPSRSSARTRGADPIVSGGPGRRGLAARVAGGSRGARPGYLAYILICSFAIDLISLRHALHVNISPRRRSFARDPRGAAERFERC